MRLAVLVLIAALAAGGAFAQPPRDAISPALSPEAAAAAFQDAVATACIPAVTGAGVAGLPPGVRGKLQVSTDAETRRQLGATADENVWDVMAGKGVVTIHEKPGRCVVSVYGPPAMTTVLAVAGKLNEAGFERLVGDSPTDGWAQSLLRIDNGKRIMVLLKGSEPGMPGHNSRFSVITATVFTSPAG